MHKTLIVLAGMIVVGAAGYFLWSGTAQNAAGPETSEYADTPAVSEELDAACKAALAYMLFPDAEAVERFLAECKEGKHPEVLERYKG